MMLVAQGESQGTEGSNMASSELVTLDSGSLVQRNQQFHLVLLLFDEHREGSASLYKAKQAWICIFSYKL